MVYSLAVYSTDPVEATGVATIMKHHDLVDTVSGNVIREPLTKLLAEYNPADIPIVSASHELSLVLDFVRELSKSTHKPIVTFGNARNHYSASRNRRELLMAGSKCYTNVDFSTFDEADLSLDKVMQSVISASEGYTQKFNPQGNYAGVLSSRQIEILQLVAVGNSTDEIAEKLKISVRTVKNHVYSTTQSLGVNNRAHAVYLAMHEGIID